VLENIPILFEDNHFVALLKPSGMPTQGDETGDKPLVDFVQDYLKITYNKPGEAYLALLHRLDRPVSGIVIFAKTSKAAARFSEMLQKREIKKTYFAIVQKKPVPEAAQLTDFIWKDPAENRSYCYKKEKKGSKVAILDYAYVTSAESNAMHLLEVNPLTGRSHQIRAQLSNIGCDILGDVKYGNRFPLRDRSICLHAFKLNFIHPVKKTPIEIMAPVPKGKGWEKFAFYTNVLINP